MLLAFAELVKDWGKFCEKLSGIPWALQAGSQAEPAICEDWILFPLTFLS